LESFHFEFFSSPWAPFFSCNPSNKSPKTVSLWLVPLDNRNHRESRWTPLAGRPSRWARVRPARDHQPVSRFSSCCRRSRPQDSRLHSFAGPKPQAQSSELQVVSPSQSPRGQTQDVCAGRTQMARRSPREPHSLRCAHEPRRALAEAWVRRRSQVERTAHAHWHSAPAVSQRLEPTGQLVTVLGTGAGQTDHSLLCFIQ